MPHCGCISTTPHVFDSPSFVQHPPLSYNPKAVVARQTRVVHRLQVTCTKASPLQGTSHRIDGQPDREENHKSGSRQVPGAEVTKEKQPLFAPAAHFIILPLLRQLLLNLAVDSFLNTTLIPDYRVYRLLPKQTIQEAASLVGRSTTAREATVGSCWCLDPNLQLLDDL